MVPVEVPSSEAGFEQSRRSESWRETDLSAVAQQFHSTVMKSCASDHRDKASLALITYSRGVE